MCLITLKSIVQNTKQNRGGLAPTAFLFQTAQPVGWGLAPTAFFQSTQPVGWKQLNGSFVKGARRDGRPRPSAICPSKSVS